MSGLTNLFSKYLAVTIIMPPMMSKATVVAIEYSSISPSTCPTRSAVAIAACSKSGWPPVLTSCRATNAVQPIVYSIVTPMHSAPSRLATVRGEKYSLSIG